MDNPGPASVLLISGDRGLSSVFHQLRLQRYNILLAAQPEKSSLKLYGVRDL